MHSKGLLDTADVMKHYNKSQSWVSRMTTAGQLPLASKGAGRTTNRYHPDLPDLNGLLSLTISKEVLRDSWEKWIEERQTQQAERVALAMKRLSSQVAEAEPDLRGFLKGEGQPTYRLVYALPVSLILVRRALTMSYDPLVSVDPDSGFPTELAGRRTSRGAIAHRLRLGGARWRQIGAVLGLRPGSAMRLEKRFRDTHLHSADQWLEQNLKEVQAALELVSHPSFVPRRQSPKSRGRTSV